MSVLKNVTSNGADIATEATLATVASNAAAALTDTQLRAAAVPVDGSGVTQPVSAASLPLPTGAATEAGNLATIAGKDFATETTLAALSAKIPASPATDRTTAASPSSVRVSNGTAFVDPTQIRALTASDVVTVQGSALSASPWSTAAIGNLSSGDNTIVAGTGGQTIKVYGWSFGVAAAANVTLYDGAAGTAKTGAYPLVANQGIASGPRLEPLFVCSTGNALVINSSAAVSAGGLVWYVKS